MDISAHVAHLARHKKIPSEKWVPGPFLDTLFDYEGFLNKGPIATAPQDGGGKEIAIIGAGISGLIAGYELLRAGFNPVIYEASDRIGGRLYTVDMGDGALAEMGAMRVPTSHRTVWHYAEHFGVPHAKFPDPGQVFTQLYYKGQTLDWHPTDEGPPAPFAEISEDFKAMMGPFAKAIYPAWQAGDFDTVRDMWQLMISRHPIDSFYEAVHRGTVWTAEQMEDFGALGLGSGGFGPMFQIDFISALRYVLEKHNIGLQLFTDGLANFVDRIVDEPHGKRTLRDCIKTNTPVTGLDWNGGCTEVQTKDAATQYDAVIVAMSSRAADMLGLTLPTRSGKRLIPQPAAQTLRELHMTAASKLFIRTKTKFWKDKPGLPEMILTDEIPRSLYCLDYPLSLIHI